jgi:hypothetical protein
MLSRLGSHVRHNVIGYVALFFALTGSALGASTVLHSGDPAGGDLTGTYPNPSIAPNAVNGSKVADGSLSAADFSGPLPGSVVARAHGSSSVSTAGGPNPYPLSGNTWTQAANETDLFVGQITYDLPPGGCDPDTAEVVVQIAVNGKPVTVATVEVGGDSTSPQTQDLIFTRENGFAGTFPGITFEPGSAIARTLTAQVSGPCSATGDFTVTSVKVNAIGFH